MIETCPFPTEWHLDSYGGGDTQITPFIYNDDGYAGTDKNLVSGPIHNLYAGKLTFVYGYMDWVAQVPMGAGHGFRFPWDGMIMYVTAAPAGTWRAHTLIELGDTSVLRSADLEKRPFQGVHKDDILVNAGEFVAIRVYDPGGPGGAPSRPLYNLGVRWIR
jgi:hypothetical protein